MNPKTRQRYLWIGLVIIICLAFLSEMIPR